MATLTSRITLKGDEPAGPEDYLSTSLGVIFPDDVTNQHGDAEHSLIYASPRLPRPLLIELADPEGETDRRLFSHYLWNASLLLAELIERDSLPPATEAAGLGAGLSFDARGLDTLELGAGTALPSIMAGLLGARSVVVTDYPAPAVMKTLRENVARNIKPDLAPEGVSGLVAASVLVRGHEWGVLDGGGGGGASSSSSAPPPPFPASHARLSDRLFVADCLWMPWQHANLRRSIDHFLRRTASARAWVVAGFHTGRANMAGFFDAQALRDQGGVEVERMWERDCDGVEREWDVGREDDITERKRWLVVAVLKRCEDTLEG
ncbi:nicotinamide n-methyltransferase [Trichoderma cornu-damae]|uniref:Nicotinamide n-methyltransferase n=1 Tax=Trichoderma cornu-damae TaxID=654480 RepID=A0A9P8QI61_9HYPO|nr:nicotinamide n-methyltransferase [Trichoderma cornu-damae]